MNRFVPEVEWQRTGASASDGASSAAEHLPLAALGDMVATVTRRWRGLALWLAICLAAAGIYLHVTLPEYTASASVILEPHRQTTSTSESGSALSQQVLDSAQAESQIQVIRSERVLSSVFDLLDLAKAPEFADQRPGFLENFLIAIGLRSPPATDQASVVADSRLRAFQAFADRVGVRRIGQSYVLEISYRAISAESASRIANAVTSAYIRAQVDLKAAAAHNGAEYLQERLSDLKAEQEAALDGVRQGRIPSILFPDADARIIGAALRPLSKSAPKGALVLAFALTFGALTGLIVIAIRHALDRTLLSRSQIRGVLKIECLGTVPDVTRLGEMRLTRRRALLGQAVIRNPESSFAHAVRSTRTAILLSAPAAKHRAIGVVSWSRGEGRTTVASNLAHLVAVSSDAVVLIDADLRNPVLTAQLAPEADAGLNEFLLSHKNPSEVAVTPLTGSLNLIPAVAAGHSSEPNTFLGSIQMQALLSELRVERDIVIDLPPLGSSSDAQALSPFLDGVILVVEAGRTTVDDAFDALRILHAANAHVIGVVLNKSKRTRAGR